MWVIEGMLMYHVKGCRRGMRGCRRGDASSNTSKKGEIPFTKRQVLFAPLSAS